MKQLFLFALTVLTLSGQEPLTCQAPLVQWNGGCLRAEPVSTTATTGTFTIAKMPQCRDGQVFLDPVLTDGRLVLLGRVCASGEWKPTQVQIGHLPGETIVVDAPKRRAAKKASPLK